MTCIVCSRVQCSHLAAFRAGWSGYNFPSKDVVEFVPAPADVRDHSLISNVERTSPSEYGQHPRQQPLIAMPPILQPMSRVLSDLTLSAAPSHSNLTSPHFTSYTTCLNFQGMVFFVWIWELGLERVWAFNEIQSFYDSREYRCFTWWSQQVSPPYSKFHELCLSITVLHSYLENSNWT